ncbi:MAG TPA: hypothetical protein DDW41_05830 [Candidatus Andersenbacteria bacterium]|nr:MAG: hypothetical protein A3A19_04870 [Candidatus Giovannonibacteria bacterium RIFCSPLOWO2_01_FULL_45_140]HBE90698.1 hypothetical protein [Candidatus Andersenbacteria bacterium]
MSPAVGAAVPMPTLPPLVTMKLVAVEDPTTKAGPEMPSGFTESNPHGLVVPIPKAPVKNEAVEDVACSHPKVGVVEP